MKTRIFLMSLLAIIGLSSADAQDIATKDVPAKVSTKFSRLYPNVRDVQWSMEEGKYEGKFNYNKQSMSVQLTTEGKLVQKEIYLKISELPKAVQDYLTKNYTGTEFEKASKKTDAKGILFYQAETKHKTLLFDSKGKFIREEESD